jgi:hypothetical protein
MDKPSFVSKVSLGFRSLRKVEIVPQGDSFLVTRGAGGQQSLFFYFECFIYCIGFLGMIMNHADLVGFYRSLKGVYRDFLGFYCDFNGILLWFNAFHGI